MNRILNRQAFFADGTPFYRLYTSDGTGYGVRLRFRTAKDNAELVTVVTDSMKADMHKNMQIAFVYPHFEDTGWYCNGTQYKSRIIYLSDK